MNTLWQDLRYAVRTLSQKPGFTVVAVLTLALGVGANTAIFSVVNSVLLRPLPYAEPARLAMLWTDDPKHGLHEEGTSYLTFADWKSQSRVFADLAVSTSDPVTLTGADAPERIETEAVAANLFPLLGIQPLLGRVFSPDDEARGERVVVLSYALWQRRFGASPDVIGKTIEINGAHERIVGVLPADFFFPTKATLLWKPMTSFQHWEREKARRFSDWFRVVGRLKPGATFAQARVEMNAIGRQLEQAYPFNAGDDFAGFSVNVVPIFEQITSPKLQLALWSLLGAIFFVLLIACTNLANLMLARGAARGREFAIRLALGASRARLVRQMLTESAALALGAGLLGLALAAAGIKVLMAFAPPNIPRLDEIRIDAGVLAFTLGLSLLASLLFGLLPAWKVSRTDPNEALKEGGRSFSDGPSRTRGSLVVIEVALAVVLLVSAGLLMRSFLRLQAVAPGFDPKGVLLARVSLAAWRTQTAGSTAPRLEPELFFQQLSERLAALPGVQGVGGIRDLFFKRNPDVPITVEGRPRAPGGRETNQITFDQVSPGFFRVMQIPLLRGRFFSEPELRRGRVAIINETLARRFFPGVDPLDQRFSFNAQPTKDDWYTVVGVVGDVRRQGLEKQAVSEIFLPGIRESMDLVVRVNSDPRALAAAVRQAIQAVDKTAVVSGVTTVESQLEAFNSERRFQTWLLGLFAALALLLAAIGIYGVMSYTVTQRTHEIGIRLALGAQRRDILKLVVGQGMAFVLIGLSAGVLAALWVTPVLASLLYGVGATDPATFALMALTLFSVALLACYLPARRATKVDPMIALRYE